MYRSKMLAVPFLRTQETNLKVNGKYLIKGNSNFTAASILLFCKSKTSGQFMMGRGRNRTTTEMTNYGLWHSEMASEWLSEGTDRHLATVSSLCPQFTGGKLVRRAIAVVINAVKHVYQEMGCICCVERHSLEALSSFKQLQLYYLSLLLLL